MSADVARILAENEERNRALSVPVNPLTGERCQGAREILHIPDAPVPRLHLPVAMMREPVVRRLRECGSVRRLYDGEAGRDGDGDGYEAFYASFWIAFCELRYRHDFEFFADNCLVIRDKLRACDVPFKLNRSQRIPLLERLENMRAANLPIRLILLKSRQWGGSTLIQLYMLWIQLLHRRNWNSVICAHVKDASLNIRAMYERAVRYLPPIRGTKHGLRPWQGTLNTREVPARGCLVTVGTAVEPDSVRSQDVKMAHFSEVAFYPDTAANATADLEASILGTIPAEPYTVVVRESTANGVGNYFHNAWEIAREGKSAYEPLFIPWYRIDIYRRPLDTDEYLGHNGKPRKGHPGDFVRTLDDYERALFRSDPGCTLEHLHWRRLKRAEMVGDAKMKQEYPSDDREAFQDSGTPAFRSEDVEALRAGCKPPVAAGKLVARADPATVKTHPENRRHLLCDIRFVEDPEATQALRQDDARERQRAQRDRLLVWQFPDTGIRIRHRYLVAFDPQKGLSEKADWGVVTVIDRDWMMYGGKPEIVARWRGRIDKDIALWTAVQIAAWYDNALLVVESNTYDSVSREDDAEFIFDTVAEHYDNLYSRTPADKIREGVPVRYGFNTNRSTKPMMLNNYTALLRERAYVETDGEALDEARTFEQKPSGAFGAREGRHDDLLMTRMIGLHVCFNEMPLPVLRPETEDYRPPENTGEATI
jgi:hypothetical protein